MIQKFNRYLFLPIAVASLLIINAGCSNYGGEVSGHVTLDGKAIQTGHVIITADNGQSATGQINEDGSYTVARPPKGKCKVTVESTKPGTLVGGGLTDPNAAKPAGAGDTKNKPPEIGTPSKIEFIEIPDKYRDLKKTPFTIDVTSSSQTFNVTMTK